jgi:hypothetical protein
LEQGGFLFFNIQKRIFLRIILGIDELEPEWMTKDLNSWYLNYIVGETT